MRRTDARTVLNTPDKDIMGRTDACTVLNTPEKETCDEQMHFEYTRKTYYVTDRCMYSFEHTIRTYCTTDICILNTPYEHTV